MAYSPGEYGWVIVDDDFPGLLMSFMKDRRDAQTWRAVKVGEGEGNMETREDDEGSAGCDPLGGRYGVEVGRGTGRSR